MEIINPSAKIISMTPNPLELIEIAGRNCYKSEDRITDESAHEFIRRAIKAGHLSICEHASATVRIICDRGISHEIVRHRLASYSQESTRYARYSDKKFGSEITVIKPLFWEPCTPEYTQWELSMLESEQRYMNLINLGAKAEQARSVLPNSLKTEIVMTANFREWKWIFHERCQKAAHPQIREIMLPLLKEMYERIPVVFDDEYEMFFWTKEELEKAKEYAAKTLKNLNIVD